MERHTYIPLLTNISDRRVSNARLSGEWTTDINISRIKILREGKKDNEKRHTVTSTDTRVVEW